MVFEQEKTEETENDITSVLSVSSCSTLQPVARSKILSEMRDFLAVVVRRNGGGCLWSKHAGSPCPQCPPWLIPAFAVGFGRSAIDRTKRVIRVDSCLFVVENAFAVRGGIHPLAWIHHADQG